MASTDYTLIMEEIYAAGAMTHAGPDVLGAIHGEDIVKLILLAILAIGILLSFSKQTFLINILRM